MQSLRPDADADLQTVGDAVRAIDEELRIIGLADRARGRLEEGTTALKVPTHQGHAPVGHLWLALVPAVRRVMGGQKSTMIARCRLDHEIALIQPMQKMLTGFLFAQVQIHVFYMHL